MAVDPNPSEIATAASDRGSASVWLVVALALSFVGLVAMVVMIAPAGGCGGG
jgi:bacteriorhodopsin